MTILHAADRTQETANNIGSSVPIVLLGAAAPGLQTFQIAGLDGDIVPYTIEHEASGQWEVGSGIYVAATHTLNRTTIYASSSGGLVNFNAGVVDVWVDMPAEKSVMLDADSSHLTLPAGLSIAGALDGVTTLLASGAATLQSTAHISGATTLDSTLTVATSVLPAADNAAPLGSSAKRWSDVRAVTATLSGLLTAAGGATISSGQTLALAGATVSGAPTWAVGQAITLTTAVQAGVTTMANLTTVGALAAGSIVAGFGSINNAGNSLTTGALISTTAVHAGNVTPSIDNTYALGTASFRWSDLRSMTATFSSAVTMSSTLTIGGFTYTFPGSQPANGFLQTNGSGALSWVTESAGISLASLSDVTLSANANGQALIYNSGTSKWNNSFVSLLTGLGTVTVGTWAAGAVSPAVDNTSALGTASFRWADVRAVTGTFAGLLTASLGLTVASGQTLTLTGATVAGAPTWSSNQAITLSTASQPNVTTAANLVTVGALASGSIAIGFGNINNAANSLTTGALVSTTAVHSGNVTPGSDNLYSLGTASFRWSDFRTVLATFTGLAIFSAGATIASGQTLTLTGATVAGAPTWSSNQAITLSTASQPNVTTMANLTTIGTLIAGAVPASLVTAGTFGTGNFVIAGNFTPSVDNSDTLGSASFRWSDVRSVLATFSGVVAHGGTATFTAANPFSVTNGQTLTVATTSQTVGAATLTLPNFASVSDTFAFITLAQTLSNKTLSSPTLSGTVAGTPTIASSWTWSSNQPITLSTAAQPNVTSLGTLAANLLFVDATYDIGASGATRARNLFLSGNITAGGTLTTGLINGQTISSAANFTGSVTVANTFTVSAGTTTLQAVTSGLINGQTISSAANFTGSMVVATTLQATSLALGAAAGFAGSTATIQTQDVGLASAQFARFSADSTGVQFVARKSRGATAGSLAAVVAGDTLLQMVFAAVAGDNSTQSTAASYLIVVPTSGVATTKVSGEHQWTTTNLAGTGAVRLKLTSEGVLAPFADNSYALGTASLRWSDFQTMTATFGGTVTGVASNWSGAVTTGAQTATLTGAGIQIATTIQNLQAAAANVGVEFDFAGVGPIRMAGLAAAWNGAATTDAYLAFYTRGSNSMVEQMRIASTGAVTFTAGITATTATLSGQLTLNADMRQYGGGRIRAEGTGSSVAAGATGVGVEIFANSGTTGYILSFDRTGVARAPLTIDASTIAFNVSANAWNMNASGHFLAGTDNTYDIGASGATRPRNLYIAGTSIVNGTGSVGGTFTVNLSGGASILNMGISPASNGSGYIYMVTSNSVKNWLISTNNISSQALEFIPSTAAGGSTFSTAAFSLLPTGALSVGGNISVPSAFAYVWGTTEYITADATTHVMTFNTNSSARMTLNAGLQMGSPTGGDKGGGTINVATGIYLNGTAYTNPDYVFEQMFTGRIEKFAKNRGAKEFKPRTLLEVEAFARETFKLPALARTEHDLFSGGDAVLESVESAYGYLFDHEKRIALLEAQIAKAA